MRGDSTAPSDDTTVLHKDVELARKAASCDTAAREGVSHLVHSLIHNLTGIFCKRYCHENHLYAKCTIFTDRGVDSKDDTLCDWGNHSYAWMLPGSFST